MKILLDVDGVLANFAEAASIIHGRSNPFLKEENLGTYSIEQIWGIPLEEFIRPFDVAFWSHIPKMPDADLIVKLLKDAFGPKNICFLTKPVKTLGCLEGKKFWLEKYYPDIPWLFGRDKNFCSHTNSILIDDNETHCRDFIESGGRAFLIPAPWNKRYPLADQPARQLEYFITSLKMDGYAL